jgi:hypothetical protein
MHMIDAGKNAGSGSGSGSGKWQRQRRAGVVPVSCHVLLCHVMPCYAMLCHVMLYDDALCYAMLCYAVQCSAVQCSAGKMNECSVWLWVARRRLVVSDWKPTERHERNETKRTNGATDDATESGT